MSARICPDILRWIPPTWNQFVGNDRIKRFLTKTVKALRREMEAEHSLDLNRLCFLLTGPSRTGKTALIEFFVRCLACRDVDPTTLDPCSGNCGYCRARAARHGLAGLEHLSQGADSWWDANHVPHFIPVDCTRIYAPQELWKTIDSLGDYEGNGNLAVVYMDEIHRLKKRGMDEILLKAVEQKPFLWVFSTAKPEDVEDMLKNRLLKFATELPQPGELADWLCDRCGEWGINWQPEAIVEVVKKSNRIVGTALHALALASQTPDEGLTLDLVENLWDVDRVQ